MVTMLDVTRSPFNLLLKLTNPGVTAEPYKLFESAMFAFNAKGVTV